MHAASSRAPAAPGSLIQLPPATTVCCCLPGCRRAMGGTVLFQDALAERLGVMHPSRDDMQRFLDGHPPQVGVQCNAFFCSAPAGRGGGAWGG